MRKVLTAAFLIASLPGICRAEPLVVHEWGTFTSLQDEQGSAIGRINTDDEPVPAFVHEIPQAGLFPATLAYTTEGKGAPVADPAVSMRLETPVLYFYLPKTQKKPLTFDIDIAFKGGWLTQYYPDARATITPARGDVSPQLDTSIGHLSWKSLTLNGKKVEMAKTQDRVWTAPRAVDSATITAGREREQFLFYRGVGHLNTPLRITRNDRTLQIHSAGDARTIDHLWLVDVRPDGTMAFRTLLRVTPQKASTTLADFLPVDYSHDTLVTLRKTIGEALIAEGLFADEAEALLNTWEQSYFKSPGTRVFFMLPRQWTDTVLPLSISVPSQVTRVMVGRIELVTPAQRMLLSHMAHASKTNMKDVTAAMTRLRNDPARAAAYNALAGGRGNLQDLGVEVPAVYGDYLALGRFRTALLLHEADRDANLLSLADTFAP